MIDIEYEKALDFGHCDTMNEAREKLSILTNLLNRVIIVRQEAKKSIIVLCASHKGEGFHKLSWDNKLLRLTELDGEAGRVFSEEWQDADTAYKQIKAKQDQVFEDINCLKKMIDFTPR